MVRILGTILLNSKQKVLASMGKEYYLDPEATEEDEEKDFTSFGLNFDYKFF